MNLTPKQLEVLQYMCQGYDLVLRWSFSHTFPDVLYLIERKTNEMKRVRGGMDSALLKKKAIIQYTGRHTHSRATLYTVTFSTMELAKQKGWIE